MACCASTSDLYVLSGIAIGPVVRSVPLDVGQG